jgi:hypothetical protein
LAAFSIDSSPLASDSFGEFDFSASSFIQDAVYRNNTNNQIGPLTAEDLFGFADNRGLTTIEHVEINLGGSAATDNIGAKAIPEPATMLLVGVGLIVFAGIGRKNIFKKKKK